MLEKVSGLGHPELVWALFWVGGVWLGAVLDSVISCGFRVLEEFLLLGVMTEVAGLGVGRSCRFRVGCNCKA